MNVKYIQKDIPLVSNTVKIRKVKRENYFKMN